MPIIPSEITADIPQEFAEDDRYQQMLRWLEHQPALAEKSFRIPSPASADASFRRYFRIADETDGHSFIVMDAPPQLEDCRPFIKVAQQLKALGVPVPEIVAQDLEQGFLLLEDFGDLTYFKALQQADESQVDALYRRALDTLIQLQSQVDKNPVGQAALQSLPWYDESLLTSEMALFIDWLLAEHLALSLSATEKLDWQALQRILVDNAQNQPQTYVLRDYHSRNLMVTEKAPSIGVLDFQDAVQGALTYDAVSLLRDCYLRWPSEQIEEWQRYYFLGLVQEGVIGKSEWSEFVKAMDLMGIQRHLKAAGIFARLFHRDGKNGYLKDIPNTLDYLVEVGSRYPQVSALVRLLENRVLPAWEAYER